MCKQEVLVASDNYQELSEWLNAWQVKSILLVCGSSFRLLRINQFFEKLEKQSNIKVTRFSEFQPNPQYESVVEGVARFREAACDAIVAVGGGSAMDVAKCIKLYANMNPNENYLEQIIVPNTIPLLLIPTTAGTGSEATRYAVIYYNGEKQSVAHESCIPSAVLMDVSALKTLPEYQKKSTMLDALCHAIESFWSVNSTEESWEYSRRTIRLILENMDGYLANDEFGNAKMLEAAYLAGKAINITQTTAGHAMCYKLSSLYGIAHGNAAALCVSKLWPYMLTHRKDCIDPRGEVYLAKCFIELAKAMGCSDAQEACEKFSRIFEFLDLKRPVAQERDYEILENSVNPIRLKNNPVALDRKAIRALYHEILN